MHALGFDHRGTHIDGGNNPYFGYQSSRVAKSDEAAMQLFGLPMSSAPDTRRGVAQPRLHDAYYSGGTPLLANSIVEYLKRGDISFVTNSLLPMFYHPNPTIEWREISEDSGLLEPEQEGGVPSLKSSSVAQYSDYMMRFGRGAQFSHGFHNTEAGRGLFKQRMSHMIMEIQRTLDVRGLYAIVGAQNHYVGHFRDFAIGCAGGRVFTDPIDCFENEVASFALLQKHERGLFMLDERLRTALRANGANPNSWLMLSSAMSHCALEPAEVEAYRAGDIVSRDRLERGKASMSKFRGSDVYPVHDYNMYGRTVNALKRTRVIGDYWAIRDFGFRNEACSLSVEQRCSTEVYCCGTDRFESFGLFEALKHSGVMHGLQNLHRGRGPPAGGAAGANPENVVGDPDEVGVVYTQQMHTWVDELNEAFTIHLAGDQNAYTRACNQVNPNGIVDGAYDEIDAVFNAAAAVGRYTANADGKNVLDAYLQHLDNFKRLRAETPLLYFDYDFADQIFGFKTGTAVTLEVFRHAFAFTRQCTSQTRERKCALPFFSLWRDHRRATYDDDASAGFANDEVQEARKLVFNVHTMDEWLKNLRKADRYVRPCDLARSTLMTRVFPAPHHGRLDMAVQRFSDSLRDYVLSRDGRTNDEARIALGQDLLFIRDRWKSKAPNPENDDAADPGAGTPDGPNRGANKRRFFNWEFPPDGFADGTGEPGRGVTAHDAGGVPTDGFLFFKEKFNTCTMPKWTDEFNQLWGNVITQAMRPRVYQALTGFPNLLKSHHSDDTVDKNTDAYLEPALKAESTFGQTFYGLNAHSAIGGGDKIGNAWTEAFTEYGDIRVMVPYVLFSIMQGIEFAVEKAVDVNVLTQWVVNSINQLERGIEAYVNTAGHYKDADEQRITRLGVNEFFAKLKGLSRCIEPVYKEMFGRRFSAHAVGMYTATLAPMLEHVRSHTDDPDRYTNMLSLFAESVGKTVLAESGAFDYVGFADALELVMPSKDAPADAYVPVRELLASCTQAFSEVDALASEKERKKGRRGVVTAAFSALAQHKKALGSGESATVQDILRQFEVYRIKPVQSSAALFQKHVSAESVTDVNESALFENAGRVKPGEETTLFVQDTAEALLQAVGKESAARGLKRRDSIAYQAVRRCGVYAGSVKDATTLQRAVTKSVYTAALSAEVEQQGCASLAEVSAVAGEFRSTLAAHGIGSEYDDEVAAVVAEACSFGENGATVFAMQLHRNGNRDAPGGHIDTCDHTSNATGIASWFGKMFVGSDWHKTHADAPFPLSVVCYRPARRYLMGSAVLMEAGRNTGFTAYAHTDVQISDDAQSKQTLVHFTGNFASVITDPRRIAVAPDVFCCDYESGEGKEFADVATFRDGMAIGEFDTMKIETFFMQNPHSDIIAVAGPCLACANIPEFPFTKADLPLDITGSFQQCVLSGRANNESHTPGKEMLHRVWGIKKGVDAQAVEDAQTDEARFFSDRRVNTTCFRAYQRTPGKRGTVSNFIRGNDHFGDCIGPGMRNARKGISGSLKHYAFEKMNFREMAF